MVVRAVVNHEGWPWPALSNLRRDGGATWLRVTEEDRDHMLEALPPVYFPGGFCMGEPADHTAQYIPVYAAVVKAGGHYYARELPINIAAAEGAALRDAISTGSLECV